MDEDVSLISFLSNNRESVEEVKLFVEAFPDSVLLERDRDGFTPSVTSIVRNCSAAIVKFLIDQWPEGLRKRDDYGRFPLHCAA